MVFVKDIVQSLLIVSEKSARIARICRQDEHLLSLLTQEKCNAEKNQRFVRDFKTLADVLVQQLIKYEIGNQFQSLKNFIYGEENNMFTNALGDSVIITLNESKANTIYLLEKILDGDEKSANVLATQIHTEVTIEDVRVDLLPYDYLDIDIEELAMWIDPIDSTAEYISGLNNGSCGNNPEFVSLNGLNCVTIIIGLFNRFTGLPIIGVMNQPFYSYAGDGWYGRSFWGLSVDDCCLMSVTPPPYVEKESPIIAVSSCENEIIKNKLTTAGFRLVSPSGAGYKILCVILGVLDAYVLSQGTTYFWDTCGCHAIMNSLGGNIWNYKEALRGNLKSILYEEKNNSNVTERYANESGIIACRNDTLTKKIIEILQ